MASNASTKASSGAHLPWYMYAYLTPGCLVGASSAFQALVVPTIVGHLRPDTAASVLGVLAGISSLTQASAPLAGWVSDRNGSRQGVIIFGLLIFGLSSQCMRLGRESFYVFAVGTIALNIGFASLQTLLSSFAIDAANGDASVASRGSGLWTAYQIIGAGVANVLVGMYIPVDKSDAFFNVVSLSCLAFVLLYAAAPRDIFLVVRGTGTPRQGTEEDRRQLLPPTMGMADNEGRLSEGDDEGSSLSSESSWWRWGWHCTLSGMRAFMSPSYHDFRLVVIARFAFFLGLAAIMNNLLYFIEDRIQDADGDATAVMAQIAMVSITITLASIYPSVMLSNRFGAASATLLGTVLMCVSMLIFPFATRAGFLYCLAFGWASAQALFGVADLALIGIVLPDESKRARDIGIWSLSSSLASSLGGTLFGVLLQTVGRTNQHSHASDSDGRMVYSLWGYIAVFWGGVLIASTSGICLLFIENEKCFRRSTPSSSDNASSTNEIRHKNNNIDESNINVDEEDASTTSVPDERTALLGRTPATT